MLSSDLFAKFSVHDRVQAVGPVNRFFAEQALGHPPTDDEAVQHYFKNAVPRPRLSLDLPVAGIIDFDRLGGQAI